MCHKLIAVFDVLGMRPVNLESSPSICTKHYVLAYCFFDVFGVYFVHFTEYHL